MEVVGLAVSVFSQPLSGSQFSSLLHRTVDDVQFIFAGTDNGQLYQVRHGSRGSVIECLIRDQEFFHLLVIIYTLEVVGPYMEYASLNTLTTHSYTHTRVAAVMLSL